MEWTIFFLPIFTIKSKRYRIRFRFIKWRGFHRRKEVFEQGDVYRFWLGFILVTAMVDTVGGKNG